jgi:hypothetical protein
MICLENGKKELSKNLHAGFWTRLVSSDIQNSEKIFPVPVMSKSSVEPKSVYKNIYKNKLKLNLFWKILRLTIKFLKNDIKNFLLHNDTL